MPGKTEKKNSSTRKTSKPKIKHRAVLTEEAIKQTLSNIEALLRYKLKKKGNHALSSRHEIYGLVVEESNELLDEVHKGTTKEIYAECADIAVAAMFGMASIHVKGLDW